GFAAQFAIGQQLGKGAFATVHEATCRASGAPLAAKVVPLGGLRDVDKMALEREISIGLELRHPENILMVDNADDAACKLADFGFARRASDSSVEEEACGTPAYVAPEVLRGASHDERADIWSLGVVVYAVLGGYVPFYAENHDELFRLVLEGRYEFHPRFWGHVSSTAKDFIRCMLVVDRRQRW
ncbi:unnamed protein product, partial [Phaeothamnion confervicola]